MKLENEVIGAISIKKSSRKLQIQNISVRLESKVDNMTETMILRWSERPMFDASS